MNFVLVYGTLSHISYRIFFLNFFSWVQSILIKVTFLTIMKSPCKNHSTNLNFAFCNLTKYNVHCYLIEVGVNVTERIKQWNPKVAWKEENLIDFTKENKKLKLKWSCAGHVLEENEWNFFLIFIPVVSCFHSFLFTCANNLGNDVC